MIGIYTGTRASAIATASPYAQQGRSFIDLDRGIFYRRQIGKRATKKRQTPAPPQLMQRGMPVWEAAGFLGMSAEVLLGTFGHHHPDFLHRAANAITAKHRASVVETAARLESARENRQNA